MGLQATGQNVGSEKQTLNFVQMAPDVCLIPAPPPPTGPQGIPTPMGAATSTAKCVDKPASKVKHKNKKVTTKNSVCSGIKGNEPGVGRLPPGKPEKDILTGVNRSKAKVMMGCPTVKCGKQQTTMMGSPGLGNVG